MENNKKIELAEQCRMVFTGYDAEGQPEFIGTNQQWQKFTNLITNQE